MAHVYTKKSNNNMDLAGTSSDDNEVVSPYSNESDVGKVTAKLDKLEQDFEGCKVKLPKNIHLYIEANIEKLRTDIFNNPNELESTTKDMEFVHNYLKEEVEKIGDNNIGNNNNNSSDDGGDGDNDNDNGDDDDGDNVNANKKHNIDPNKTDNNTGNDSTSNANNDKKREKKNLF